VALAPQWVWQWHNTPKSLCHNELHENVSNRHKKIVAHEPHAQDSCHEIQNAKSLQDNELVPWHETCILSGCGCGVRVAD